MIWVQSGFSFLLWIGYGILQNRRSDAIRKQVGAMSRLARGLAGAALFLVGMMVLIGGLTIVLQLGGFTAYGLTPTAWFAVTALGLAFVHAQAMGTAMLVSLVQENVTNDPQATSIITAQGDHTQT